MLEFCSGTQFVDEYVDYTDYVISLERAYEYFSDYVDKAFIPLDFSFEGSDDQGTNKVTFLQRLRKIWDAVVNFFKTAINRLKELIKKAWNALFKSNYSKDSVMSKKVWVLYSWISGIRSAYKKKDVPADTYSNILNTHITAYNKAIKNEDPGVQKKWLAQPTLDLDAFEFTDELQYLKRIQDFLAKLAGSQNTAAIKKAVSRGTKADINKSVSANAIVSIHKSMRTQPITYLYSLIKDMGKDVDLGKLKEAINSAVTFVKSQSKCILEWIKRVVKCMNDSHEKYQGSKGILKIFKMPADVKKALENHYKTLVQGNSHPLSANSAIVYSETIMHDPRFSEGRFGKTYKEVVQSLKGRLGGATNTTGFKKDPGKGMFKGMSAIFPAEKVLNMKTEKLAFLFVHEFGHIYDNQSVKMEKGKRAFTMDRVNNNAEYSKNYRNDPMENFANRAATKAIPKYNGELACLLSWVKKIQDEVKEYAERIKYNESPDAKDNASRMETTVDIHEETFKNT